MPTHSLSYFVDEAGRSPFERWYDGLGEQEAAIVTVRLERLGFGHMSNVRPVGSGVHELRIHYGPGYRVYFGRPSPGAVVLLTGGTKRGQRADIQSALRLWSGLRGSGVDDGAGMVRSAMVTYTLLYGPHGVDT